jgi:hypothetical protein
MEKQSGVALWKEKCHRIKEQVFMAVQFSKEDI